MEHHGIETLLLPSHSLTAVKLKRINEHFSVDKEAVYRLSDDKKYCIVHSGRVAATSSDACVYADQAQAQAEAAAFGATAIAGPGCTAFSTFRGAAAYAEGDCSFAKALVENSLAIATGADSNASAHAAGAIAETLNADSVALSVVSGAVAKASVAGSTAISMTPGAVAMAMVNTSSACAWVAGAKAIAMHVGATVRMNHPEGILVPHADDKNPEPIVRFTDAETEKREISEKVSELVKKTTTPRPLTAKADGMPSANSSFGPSP